VKRGEIYWTNLDPTQGHEIKKTRPCIVVSNDVGNEFSETVTVVPLTSKTNNKKVYPFEVIAFQKKKAFPLRERSPCLRP